MPNIKEHPRGGVANSPIENAGEMHLPCVILVDTSGSMGSSKQQLLEGLASLKEALDEQAKGRVEFCIIGFDNDAHILVPFGPAYDFQVPEIECTGMTAMHAAVDYALGELDARKNQYKANNTVYYRPWIFMLTDGGANDSDNGSFERLIQAQKDKRCTFFPVAIGSSVDKDLLKRLSVSGTVITASRENFKGAFVWLSNSLSRTSSSNPGQVVTLPSPGDYQLTIEA